ncbi:hypothetical protein FB446DRAFT_700532 [Lentinula raphanica]|nr:hypothetical protein FB446DRAFT_700532 [Lentinula raphanica]
MKFFSSLSLLLAFFAFTFQAVLVNAISNNPDSACSGFWNHWTHHEGSSCKFYSDGGVVDGTKVISTTTVNVDCHLCLFLAIPIPQWLCPHLLEYSVPALIEDDE